MYIDGCIDGYIYIYIYIYIYELKNNIHHIRLNNTLVIYIIQLWRFFRYYLELFIHNITKYNTSSIVKNIVKIIIKNWELVYCIFVINVYLTNINMITSFKLYVLIIFP